MLREIDNFFLQQQEPLQSCFLGLRDFILNYDEKMTEAWKYKMPCYCYRGKPFCYLWKDKKTGKPYLLMVEGRHIDHPALVAGDRARMKILFIDPEADLPIDTIDAIFQMGIKLFEKP